MYQLSLDSIEKVEKLKEITFHYSITTPYKSYSSVEYFICDVNGLSKTELVEKCEAEMRKRLNYLFDGYDCSWKVKVLKKTKILH
jgi:hypothetical protein